MDGICIPRGSVQIPSMYLPFPSFMKTKFVHRSCHRLVTLQRRVEYYYLNFEQKILPAVAEIQLVFLYTIFHKKWIF